MSEIKDNTENISENNSSKNLTDNSIIQNPNTVTAVKKSAVKLDIFDIIAFLLTTATVFDTVYTILSLPYGHLLSIVHSVFFVLIALMLIIKKKHFPKKAVFPAVLLILTIVSHSIFNFNPLLRLIFSCYLFGYFVSALTGADGFPLQTTVNAFQQLKALFVIPVKKVFAPFKCIKISKNSPHIKKLAGILVGSILGIPVFAVSAFLLMSGDTAFGDVFSDIFGKVADWIFEILDNFFDYAVCVIATVLLTPFIYSFIFSSKYRLTEETEDQEIKNSVKKLHFINSSVLFGFYSVISLCYIIFIFSQLKYLFSAFSDTPAYGYSISEYARNGFFEMSAVAIINLSLIAAGVIFTKRNEKEELSKIYKVFSAFFCLFTVLLIVIAITKMAHYVTGYGLTEKRIAVLLADIVLLITFICIFIKLFKNNFPYLRIASSAALVAICLFLTVGTDIIVANFNTEMYLSGKHSEIDISTISKLDSNYCKILNLDKLTNDTDENTAGKAKSEIYRLYKNSENISDYSYTLDGKLLANYCSKNSERFGTYRKYSIYHSYEQERILQQESSYYTGMLNLEISVPDAFTRLEISNSLVNTVVYYDDGTAFNENEVIRIFDWVYSEEEGLMAAITAFDTEGNQYKYEIRFDDKILTENENKTVKVPSYYSHFYGAFLYDETGDILLVNTDTII
ncbi:MAG: DUF4173 domain-containing protein [Clostridia bacterium]|nr:DUF4173 domain-containing protein [Clostridia bacterium]